MPVRRVLTTPSPDPAFRAEEVAAGVWRLYHHGALVVDRGSLDDVVAKVLDLGGDPSELVED